MNLDNEHEPAELVLWCDSEFAIVLDPKARVVDPVEIEEADEYVTGEKPWPTSPGTIIQLVSSGEIFCVHNETLISVKCPSTMV
jgi:hypothetical protein